MEVVFQGSVGVLVNGCLRTDCFTIVQYTRLHRENGYCEGFLICSNIPISIYLSSRINKWTMQCEKTLCDYVALLCRFWIFVGMAL